MDDFHQSLNHQQVSLFSEPVFCLATTSSYVACGSAKPPIVLLPPSDIESERIKVNYPPSSRGVGSMAFSTSGKTLVAGFWDGSIRAFSVKKLTILLYLDLHSETIAQMVWSEVNGDEHLVVASMDEKLSLWKLK
ncbi:WD domain, G-beta repeat protein [Teladorsagia circumcincta]|uniref:WD domain, G-beta repeat protein n=1 Tax=Teladorsagia circumcincta TaxID=45464 RepID=A0A2G9UAN4_TELCI|nr:WD domain, G-beta repeat protein [Teladorsagia circumcincta]